MKMIRLFFLAFVFFSLSARASEDVTVFSPARGGGTVITVEGDSLTWNMYHGGDHSRGRVDVETEKPIYVDVGDYDFSGRLGFSVWHVDDGMGTYSIYRILTFSPSTNEFLERSPAPQCGDEFINLRVDKKRRRLVSTYWDQNIPRACVTHLSPLK